MDEDVKKLLNEDLAVNKANNEMLKKLVLYQKWNQIYKIVYWSIIILSVLGAFYFIKPYLSSLLGIYNGGIGSADISNIGNFSDKGQIQSLIDAYQGN
jgi:hypothetical protein